ncbi:hypothetical protein AB6A40_001036 [Gnathostoma spinigerum]|uniref:Uncharacterized protein n=1 Tax=Gnathostoma spinigerum TaxID=75299 RepID=A0ABD6ECB2_9BILA
MSVQKSLLSATFAYSLLIIVHLFGQTASLTCYENDAYGNLYEVSNSTWNYCALVPSSTSRYGEGRVFGVGPTGDWTEAYDETFALSDKVYKILTICILEVGDFVLPITCSDYLF